MGAEDHDRITRRDAPTKLGGGLAGLSISPALPNITRAESDVAKSSLKHFTSSEGQLLEALGDTLVPGAAEAGILRYVDDQLGRPETLLFLRYMDYLGSYEEFYKQGLDSLENQSHLRYRDSFLALDAEKKITLVREIAQKNPVDWKGPPAPLFYFVVRNDAIDVTYGTPEGFAKLEIPYMAMIDPPRQW